MKWINNKLLFFKSHLKKDEKKHLNRIMKSYQANNNYKIKNYHECKRLVEIGYKLVTRMDYLNNKGKLLSDEYKNMKDTYQCINISIKEYSL